MSAKPFGEPSGSSSSYGGNPLAAAAGLAAVEVIIAEKLVENSARVGALMLAALKELQEKYRFIGDVRGRGLMIGVELVADRTTKTPLDTTITRSSVPRGIGTRPHHDVVFAYHSHQPAPCPRRGWAMFGVDILDQWFAAISAQFRARLEAGVCGRVSGCGNVAVGTPSVTCPAGSRADDVTMVAATDVLPSRRGAFLARSVSPKDGGINV